MPAGRAGAGVQVQKDDAEVRQAFVVSVMQVEREVRSALEHSGCMSVHLQKCIVGNSEPRT